MSTAPGACMAEAAEAMQGIHQDPPCTLNWGYMVPNSRYLGPNRG